MAIARRPVDALFGDALTGDGGTADPVPARQPGRFFAGVFPDALAMQPLAAVPTVAAGGSPTGSGTASAVSAPAASSTSAPASSGAPVGAGARASRPVRSAPKAPVLAPGAGRRPVAGAGYSPPPTVPPVRAAKPRAAKPRGTNRVAKVWAGVVPFVVLLFSAGIGEKIVRAVTEWLHRR